MMKSTQKKKSVTTKGAVKKSSTKKVKSAPKVTKKKVSSAKKSAQKRQKEVRIVAVSGGFDPVHIGHVRMFNEAKALGDRLVVILNNDAWLRTKKGQEFMSEDERKEIIEAFEAVDEVILTDHIFNDKDRSVCRALRSIRPHVFANGGDRKPDDDPVPEVDLCKELGIEMFYNVGAGGKVQSSSWLLKKHEDHKKKQAK